MLRLAPLVNSSEVHSDKRTEEWPNAVPRDWTFVDVCGNFERPLEKDAMTNERLSGALLDARLTYDHLSQQVGVDPKTVERWITRDRVPHRSHRLRVAAILGRDDTFLW